ncbi:MAG: hypothetical protein ABII10_02975 [Candidatus Paceibacterota bacterium]
MLRRKAEQTEVSSNWRDDPHPFYQLVANFLDGNGYEPATLPELNLDFWQGAPPKEIILATGSTRKALMLSVVLNKIDLPFLFPMDYQRFTTENIRNGNGSLQHKVLLGFYEGVPVYAHSAAAGESAANNPRQEALNKAQWLANQSPYKDDAEDYLVITTDAVDFPDKNGNGKLDEEAEGLGKPMNEPDYPQANFLQRTNKSILHSLGEKIHQWQVKKFDREYIEKNYQVEVELIHVNSIALLEIMAQESLEVIEIWDVIIRKLMTTESLEKMHVYPDQGGGGASQQNQNWEVAEEVLATLDEETQGLLAPYFEQDPEFFKMLVLFQISGMPAMNILHEIEKWAQDRANRTSETVVFEQENQ